MSYLQHHGVKGQKWGVRRYQNEDGTRTAEGKERRRQERVFISGTSKMQSMEEGYYREKLASSVTDYLDELMSKKARILIGDCVGADTMVQKYLVENGYNNVHIYVSGDEVRNNADSTGSLGWKIHNIDSSMYEVGSKDWHATKDKAMDKRATSGMGIILDEGAKATRKNIDRFIDSGRDVSIFELSKNGDSYDRWLSKDEYERSRK